MPQKKKRVMVQKLKLALLSAKNPLNAVGAYFSLCASVSEFV
jgi:hypothetical protein